MRYKIYYQYICLVSLFLIPILLLIPYQFKKQIIENPLMWILLTIGLLLLPQTTSFIKKQFKQSFVLQVYSLYLLTVWVTTILSINPISSSLHALLYTIFFIFFSNAHILLNTKKLKEGFLLLTLGVTSILCLISSANFLSHYKNIEPEGVSFMWIYFGHNHLAALLIIAIPLCLFFILKSKSKLSRYSFFILLLFYLMNLFITFSRGAMISLIFSFIITLGFFRSRFLKKIKGILLSTSLVISIVFVFLLLIVYIKASSGISSRLTTIHKVIEIALVNPITGQGPGMLAVEYKKGIVHTYFAHNIFIQILSEQGIVGLTTFVFLLITLIKKAIQTIKYHKDQNGLFYFFLGIALASILINEMVDFDLQLPVFGSLFWLLAGVLVPSINSKKIKTYEQ